MNKILALIELEAQAASCINISLATRETVDGMYYHFYALVYQEDIWDLWSHLTLEEKQQYAEVMDQMTGIEDYMS